MPDPRDALFSSRPVSRDLYGNLLTSLSTLGSFQEEVKKTCIHLVRKSAFAGVHPRKEHLILTIKSAAPIRSSRVVKSEQASANRWHLDVKVATAGEIDRELIGWLRGAYELCG
jgi:hypothetical protein